MLFALIGKRESSISRMTPEEKKKTSYDFVQGFRKPEQNTRLTRIALHRPRVAILNVNGVIPHLDRSRERDCQSEPDH